MLTPGASVVRLVWLLPIAVGSLWGCSQTSGSGEQPTEAVSKLTRDRSPDVPIADQTAIENGNATFAFAAFTTLFDRSTNLALSPYSLSSGLAMTYAGARGSTASEIATALHFTLPQERLHPAFDWLDLQLASRASEGAPTAAQSSQPFTLHMANSTWAQPQNGFEQSFLDTLAVDYGAGLHLIGFANPEQATESINTWTSGQTDGKIPDVLPSGALDSLSVLVLIDAIYFDAGWAQPFNKSQTSTTAFTRTDGTTVHTPTMAQASTFPYAAGDGYQAVELGYAGGNVAMDIVLPAANDGAAFAAGLTPQKFGSIATALQPTVVGLTLPKFSMHGASNSVVGMLSRLGVHTAFSDDADFTGICAAGGIYVKNVYHQVFVAVDEAGTEAAAATAVVFDDAAIVETQAEMDVNRPFLFVIRDLPTGTVLFMGWVADPTM